MEGTVLRSGDEVRITAQLIEGATDRHVWSQSYQGELRNTLALQNTVAKAIADQIRISVNPQEQAALRSATVVNPVAYESYLKGRYFWNKRTADGLKTALAYFNQAIDEDPKYAPGLRRAGRHVRAAGRLAVCGDDAEGRAAESESGGDARHWSWTTRSARPTHRLRSASMASTGTSTRPARNSSAASNSSPGYATAHHWYAWHLALFSVATTKRSRK